MTVGELIRDLSKYPSTKEVYFTLEGAQQYFSIDKIELTEFGGNPYFTCDSAPEFDDIEGMADACWDGWYKHMSESQKDAIREFSRKADDALSRWEE